MSQNGISYNQNPKASWFDDDDVDDEEFLKNSRKPSSTNQNVQNHIQQLAARKDAIENRTLASTERSLTLLRESEQVGVATAQELAAQREQLERTSRNLDSINATLRTTQRNIDGMKSIFSSLKNYFTGPKNLTDPAVSRPSASSEPSTSEPYEPKPLPHQASRIQEDPVRPPANAQEAIDRNLSYMSDNITNLRGLALNLGDEILEQNELVDSLQYKTEKAGITINTQNTQINRLLGKK